MICACSCILTTVVSLQVPPPPYFWAKTIEVNETIFSWHQRGLAWLLMQRAAYKMKSQASQNLFWCHIYIFICIRKGSFMNALLSQDHSMQEHVRILTPANVHNHTEIMSCSVGASRRGKVKRVPTSRETQTIQVFTPSISSFVSGTSKIFLIVGSESLYLGSVLHTHAGFVMW